MGWILGERYLYLTAAPPGLRTPEVGFYKVDCSMVGLGLPSGLGSLRRRDKGRTQIPQIRDTQNLGIQVGFLDSLGNYIPDCGAADRLFVGALDWLWSHPIGVAVAHLAALLAAQRGAAH